MKLLLLDIDLVEFTENKQSGVIYARFRGRNFWEAFPILESVMEQNKTWDYREVLGISESFYVTDENYRKSPYKAKARYSNPSPCPYDSETGKEIAYLRLTKRYVRLMHNTVRRNGGKMMKRLYGHDVFISVNVWGKGRMTKTFDFIDMRLHKLKKGLAQGNLSQYR